MRPEAHIQTAITQPPLALNILRLRYMATHVAPKRSGGSGDFQGAARPLSLKENG